jgi:hypothetical protein
MGSGYELHRHGIHMECGTCSASGRGYAVSGYDAREVADVVRVFEQQRLANQGPWRAGMFYLTCLAVICAVFLVVAQVASVWILPVIAAASIISVVVLGALQLRQDNRLSEAGLVSLVSAALRSARFLTTPVDPQPPAPDQQQP